MHVHWCVAAFCTHLTSVVLLIEGVLMDLQVIMARCVPWLTRLLAQPLCPAVRITGLASGTGRPPQTDATATCIGHRHCHNYSHWGQSFWTNFLFGAMAWKWWFPWTALCWQLGAALSYLWCSLMNVCWKWISVRTRGEGGRGEGGRGREEEWGGGGGGGAPCQDSSVYDPGHQVLWPLLKALLKLKDWWKWNKKIDKFKTEFSSHVDHAFVSQMNAANGACIQLFIPLLGILLICRFWGAESEIFV